MLELISLTLVLHFYFNVFPQPLPVVILGLDFISILAAATYTLNSEVMVQLLLAVIPGSVSNSDFYRGENNIRL